MGDDLRVRWGDDLRVRWGEDLKVRWGVDLRVRWDADSLEQEKKANGRNFGGTDYKTLKRDVIDERTLDVPSFKIARTRKKNGQRW